MSHAIHLLLPQHIKTAKPKDKPYRLNDGGNLYLEIKPSGGKYWYTKYWFLGREKRISHGPFPTVGLADAREKHQAAKRLLLDNIDPALAKRAAKRKAELEAKNTFKAIALEWHENSLERWSEDHAKEIMKALERDVFPKLGNVPIKDITTPEVVTILQAIENRGARETARRIKYICSQVFLYAKVKGWINNNPTDGVNVILKPVIRKHFAAITIDELPHLLKAIDESTTTEQLKLAVRMMLLTFVRTTELTEMRWDEVDFSNALWVIKAERMKGKKHQKRSHTVPLSRQVIVMLERLKELSGKSEYVFQGRSTWKKPMSNMAILQLLRRLGYAKKMTGHGFRALAKSTIMEKLNYREEVPDRQLAHAPDTKYGEAYDRSTFLTDRIKMMQDWADYIDELYASSKLQYQSASVVELVA